MPVRNYAWIRTKIARVGSSAQPLTSSPFRPVAMNSSAHSRSLEEYAVKSGASFVSQLLADGQSQQIDAR